MRRSRAIAVLAAATAAAAGAVPALAAFEDEEPANFAKTDERYERQTATPDFQTLLIEKSLESKSEEAAIASGDPERNPFGNLCFQHGEGCAGDVRFYDWNKEAGNIRRGPILWTARSGATISGHVWAVEGGPAKRPGIVITNGSVQAPEQL